MGKRPRPSSTASRTGSPCWPPSRNPSPPPRAAAETAGKLDALRRAKAPGLARQATAMLRKLGFPKAAFSISLDPLEPGGTGAGQQAEFLFAPNPGEPSQPLRAIASSGEISRVMLALKSVLAAEDAVPLLVFDEIDANVGGETAVQVGLAMRALGTSHQVFCITHLPQVAAAAETQFVVRKEFAEGRTRASLAALEGEERVAELARMLGDSGGHPALELARTLLRQHT